MSDSIASEFEQQARDYLRQQLGPQAPDELRPEATFDEQPLENEAATALFSFKLAPANAVATREASPLHYVAVGQTQPNYFPAYGLSPEEAYSMHVGTRFMLELGVARLDAPEEPEDARENMRGVVREHAPEAKIEDEELVALFRCDDQRFAVYRLTLDGEPVYCMGADCPPGFYRLTEYPPQVALRLHLGKLIREEARLERLGLSGRE